MTRRPVEVGDPERLYTVTGGRSRAPDDSLDLVTLVVAECAPVAGMQKEHLAILEMCRSPTAVVEISAELRMPVTVVRILLGDLLATGRITARQPRAADEDDTFQPRSDFLMEVLHGLRNL